MEIVSVWLLIVLIQPGTMAATSFVVDNIASQEECVNVGKTALPKPFYRDEGTVKMTCIEVKKLLPKIGASPATPVTPAK